MPKIHPRALVSERAEIAENVQIGPFAIIDAGVRIDSGCTIGPQAWITGRSILGRDNKIGCGSIIGDLPQDTSFDPETDSNVIIGDNNTIREYVTINRSTANGGSTVVGNDNFIMTGAHLAHDVTLGNHNILANNVLVAGHIQMGNHNFLGGGSGYHQFLHIGDYCMIQGNSAITRDVPPYCMAHGQNKLAGLNTIGLRRAGFNAEQRKEIKRAYKILFHNGGNLAESLAMAESELWPECAMRLINAVRTPSRKGVMTR
ncbi:acyl-ACP--UDP-N-acetylglucosamine O-acyltransferase [Verrucomicrobiaceae bacterium N1E253]|uniref:Acyl-ACP--UDP-N-acetylglucosamine O-acyltransferase n=1 Tax=Oceaniferula marina TaxID=2748318 RepID=A0A851GGE4_9BACT|nr:acyl-ACP--UDP-N-acetylglucosamine O-acyltransferase [Oceaniferula marina]NWK56858.1 acyl-ACP--UDP-N-acetylglucosamine O-acyltransferase [Oceaniferula marina]